MRVDIKLFSGLARYRPDVLAGTPFTVELPDGSSVSDLITHLGIRPNEVKGVAVNGRGRSTYYRLQPGDVVDIFPPMGGG